MIRQATSHDLAMDWRSQPQAAAVVQDALARFCDGWPDIHRFRESLRERTGSRLIDWIDHIALPASDAVAARLESAGFLWKECDDDVAWSHPGGLFPQILTHANASRRLAIRVDSVADFLAAHGFDGQARIEGAILGAIRKARVFAAADREFWVVERHGDRGWEALDDAPGQASAILAHQQAFEHRQRRSADVEQGLAELRRLIAAAVGDLGADRASDVFFAAERRYWTSRNLAAQLQKARQDALGLGWGNHDHHTYRSGRGRFRLLIALMEELGLVCRERFYAGREAGWGAQVMEQEQSQVVVFADVDLSASEVSADFAHEPLPPQAHFGTVGLWCLLHGEAILEPGMHHLECRFDLAAVRAQLEDAGIRVMKPFTDLPYLKQAFTEGELWPVPAERCQAALAAGAITRQQADEFRLRGALGSHLEILQRDEGYKGFNQSGINEILRATDPRLRLDDIAARRGAGS